MRIDPATFKLSTVAPAPNEALREAIYDGQVYLLAPTTATQRLVCRVQDRLEQALGPEPRLAQHRMSNEALFERLRPVRREIYLDSGFHESLREVIAAAGFDPQAVAFDPLRLRVVRSRGEDIAAARAVYYPHRDTWYAHPPGLIAWWIPLDDLVEEETFEIYPDCFAVEVPNDSETFDYDDWVKDGWELKIGWQKADSGLTAHYPGVLGELDAGRAVGFSCRRAQNLLFAGAHLHQTRAQATGRTRFSLDFRIVHLGDHAAGLGAPCVDCFSRGSSLRDYVHPPAGSSA